MPLYSLYGSKKLFFKYYFAPKPTSMKKIYLPLLICAICNSLIAQTADFEDVSATAGINNQGKNYGAAIGDYNNDGLEDVYVTRQSGEANLLYHNNGDGTFTDVAVAVGLADTNDGMMSLWGDIDNDGDLDLYVGNRNGNDVLYLNEDGQFTDISASAGITSPYQPRSLNFADIDLDGDLDINIANINDPNVLYQNNGDNTFNNVVISAGASDSQIAQGAIFFDYDFDSDADLYLTHDANQTFILYENNGQGSFQNVAAQTDTDLEKQGMGVDVADFNQDGHQDMYFTNLYENSLLINDGDGTYTDISATANIEDLGMGWGIICMDYDNDTYADIYVCNESNVQPMRPNILYRNNGDETFTAVSNGLPVGSNYRGTGAACADFNDDGMTDIFVANKGVEGNQLFLNQTENDHNWIKIKTEGTTNNRDGVGTRVTLLAGGKTLVDEVIAGSGFASQNSLTLQFGLGAATTVDQLTVRWPGGQEDVYTDIAVNQKIKVVEGGELITNTVKPELDVKLQFQNPSSSSVVIQYATNEGNLDLSIADVKGVLLMQKGLIAGEASIKWEAPGSGLYFVRIEGEGGRVTKILVVK